MSIMCRKSAITACLAASFVLASLPAAGQPKEWVKYLNPIPKEKGYLNQSQDRLIKKKKFKTEEMPDTKRVINKESGFFAVVPGDKVSDMEYLLQLLANERVDGLSVIVPWKLLNPTEDEYNWEPVDRILDLLNQSGKSLILRVSTAGLDWPSSGTSEEPDSDTPAWVFEDEVKYAIYIGSDGKKHKAPVFWDPTYLAKWSNFVKDMGKRYDKHPNLHSIGITGGGFQGTTSVLPTWKLEEKKSGAKADRDAFRAELEKEHGLNLRKVVEHWKYVADLFPQAFSIARLNLACNGPVPGRKGEDALDEIADYLVYRYGNRIYLTRQGIKDGKHRFDEWRLLLKFHHDTITGLALTPQVDGEALQKLAKTALEDGVSFLELPPELLLSEEDTVSGALDKLAAHIGHQVLAREISIPAELPAGQKLPAVFTFFNAGSAAPMRAERAFDKDVAASYKVQLELRDANGRPLVQTLHTPDIPTNEWSHGKPYSWQAQLGISDLKPGEYAVFLSLIDPVNKHSIRFIDARTDEHVIASEIPLGTLKIVEGDPAASRSKIEAADKAPRGVR